MARPSKLTAMSVEIGISCAMILAMFSAPKPVSCNVSLPPLVRAVGCRVRRPSVVPEEAR